MAHCGASPIGVRENFRAVSYNCFLPASFLRGGSALAGEVEKDGRIDADSILPGRLEAYTGMQTGDTGLPNERRKDLSVRPYFTDGHQG